MLYEKNNIYIFLYGLVICHYSANASHVRVKTPSGRNRSIAAPGSSSISRFQIPIPSIFLSNPTVPISPPSTINYSLAHIIRTKPLPPSSSSFLLPPSPMEMLLESAIEAVIFRYSTTLAGYIWTILALFAAALSLWGFRFLRSGTESESASKSPATVIASTPAIVPSAITTLETESIKGRFTMHFLAEEETDGDDADDEWVSDRFSSGTDCLDCLDRGWKGDLGWYICQDRTAINGSVVKLWDSGRAGGEMRWCRRFGDGGIRGRMCGCRIAI